MTMVRDTATRRRGSLRRAGAWIALLALVGGALGFASAAAVASTYAGAATVLVTPLEGNPFNPTGNGDDLNNLQSEAQLAQSDAVANLVPAPGAEATAGLTVTVPANTQLLEFRYEAKDAETARAGAEGFARAYLRFRTSRADQAVVARAREIQDEINAQGDRINDLAAQKRGVSSTEQRAVLQQQMDGIATQVVQLSTTLSAVTTVDRDPGQVVTGGHLVGLSPDTNRLLFTACGLVLGALVGGLLSFGTRRSRPRSHGMAPPADELASMAVIDRPAVERTPDLQPDPTAGDKELVGRGPHQ